MSDEEAEEFEINSSEEEDKPKKPAKRQKRSNNSEFDFVDKLTGKDEEDEEVDDTVVDNDEQVILSEDKIGTDDDPRYSTKITKYDKLYFGDAEYWEKPRTHEDNNALRPSKKKPFEYGAVHDCLRCYADRKECAVENHYHPMAGINGSGRFPAASIVTMHCGGYPDVDYGEILLYTGWGGSDTLDQPLTKYNLSLAYNLKRRVPVRVIRGYQLPSIYAPKEGYRYDGLYWVTAYWLEPRPNLASQYKFRMVRLPNQPPIPKKKASEIKKYAAAALSRGDYLKMQRTKKIPRAINIPADPAVEFGPQISLVLQNSCKQLENLEMVTCPENDAELKAFPNYNYLQSSYGISGFVSTKDDDNSEDSNFPHPFKATKQHIHIIDKYVATIQLPIAEQKDKKSYLQWIEDQAASYYKQLDFDGKQACLKRHFENQVRIRSGIAKLKQKFEDWSKSNTRNKAAHNDKPKKAQAEEEEHEDKMEQDEEL